MAKQKLQVGNKVVIKTGDIFGESSGKTKTITDFKEKIVPRISGYQLDHNNQELWMAEDFEKVVCNKCGCQLPDDTKFKSCFGCGGQ